MKKKPRILPKNTLTLMTQGAYSDFCVSGLFKTTQNLDVSLLQKEFKSEQSIEENEDYYDRIDKFLIWLVKKEYFIEVDHSELYLGSYGELSL